MKTGLTILEVVLAVGIIVVTSGVVFPTLAWLITKSKQVEYGNQAGVVMAQNIEVAYNVLLDDWEAGMVGKIYQPGVEMDAGGQKWTLVPGKGTAQSRFERWVEMEAVCRDGETEVRQECSADSPPDQNSKIVKSFVKWREKAGDEVISGELLVVRL